IYASAAGVITTTIVDITPEPDANMATATDDVIALTTAADPAAAITITNIATVGTAGTIALELTTPAVMNTGDFVQVTFPANFDISAVSTAAGAATSTFNTNAATFTASQSGQVLTLTLTATATAPAESGTITIPTGIKSIYASAAGVITTTIVDITPEPDANMATATDDVIVASTVGDVTSTNVEPANLSVGTPSANTISFTTTAEIPNLGKIVITYPSGFGVASVAGVVASSLSGLDGTWTATVSGQVVTLTQTGGGATAAGAKSLILATGIVTPGATGSTGTYTITTTTAADLNIETDAAITADTIVAYSSSSSSSSSSGGGGGGGGGSSSKTTKTTTTTTETTTATDTETTTDTATDESATTEEDTSSSTDASTETSAVATPITVETKSGSTVTLTDIPADHWATDMVKAMISADVVRGNEDGTFKPEGNLNRAEAAALLYRIMGLEDPANPEMKPFTDVELDQWYAGYIAELKAREVVNGNPNGTYQPSKSINRAEFLKMAESLYKYLADDDTKIEMEALEKGETTSVYKDVSSTDWYAGVVTAATEKGFIGGKEKADGKYFDGGANITRAEATKVLYTMFGKMLGVNVAE
ncbi:hypothetical protein CO044_02650, partial [Candidatus Peregrinibacteria bacterium CG_4_9_14_0_2_um_filter_38_9]